MNRRSFLKRTAVFVAVAVGVPATMIPKVLEAAPVVPHLTIPYHTIYAPEYPNPMIPEIWAEAAAERMKNEIDNQILQDILNTKRKG